jgi:anti-anti-sigma factor
MEVKTDTKEKFHVIRVITPHLSANMAAELNLKLSDFLKASTKNIVLNLSEVESVEEEAGEILVRAQQNFYEQEASFVICGLQPGVETELDRQSLLEMMNVTPTESEAWDIVQMEEIERDLMGDEYDNEGQS